MKRALIALLVLGLTIALPLTASAETAHRAKTHATVAHKADATHKSKTSKKSKKSKKRRAIVAAQPAMPTLVAPATQPGLLPDMTIGNPDAAVTVTEYASAACPHCAAWNAENWDNFEANYLATGKVRYVFREVLTPPQEYAMAAFMTGRCAVAASKDKTSSRPYFAVLQSYYAGQVAYAQTGLMTKIKSEVTKKTGMNEAAQLKCLADATQFTAFMASMRAHTEADNVHTTPTFFVNGNRLDSHDMKDIAAAIEAASK